MPLSFYFLENVMDFMKDAISLYKQETLSTFTSVTVVAMIKSFACLLAPLFILTRVEKFYLWTLREVLHHNASMPRAEHSNLIAIYDTIAPRVSLFGFYLTRIRVMSITLALLGLFTPKVIAFLYENL